MLGLFGQAGRLPRFFRPGIAAVVAMDPSMGVRSGIVEFLAAIEGVYERLLSRIALGLETGAPHLGSAGCNSARVPWLASCAAWSSVGGSEPEVDH
jgi:hypothetical protein